VVNTSGGPVAGASVVTLLSEAPGQSSFVAVAPGTSIDPETNPEVTPADGSFHWDAVAGTYQVEATAPGCHAPGSTQATVRTPPVYAAAPCDRTGPAPGLSPGGGRQPAAERYLPTLRRGQAMGGTK
jgi:hypothetical protein